ncbi:RNA polymerase sigma factor, partial [Singulisphaera acidiphila]
MVGSSGLKDLGRLFSEGTDAGQSDGRLLERFVARRDEAAFSALVTRHGSLVLGVCRRLLRDPNDVEDAFQAVFLVLVRRSGSLRDGDRLASWLYGVAYRVSLRARANAARRLGR